MMPPPGAFQVSPLTTEIRLYLNSSDSKNPRMCTELNSASPIADINHPNILQAEEEISPEVEMFPVKEAVLARRSFSTFILSAFTPFSTSSPPSNCNKKRVLSGCLRRKKVSPSAKSFSFSFRKDSTVATCWLETLFFKIALSM